MIRPRRCRNGFTLVELLVVLAILMLLFKLAVPKYFSGVSRAKEAALRQDLSVTREALDKFYGDQGRYPRNLDELAERKYIREVPVDPVTESRDTWLIVPPVGNEPGNVYDLHSGAPGKTSDGTPYGEL